MFEGVTGFVMLFYKVKVDVLGVPTGIIDGLKFIYEDFVCSYCIINSFFVYHFSFSSLISSKLAGYFSFNN
jgi:hypothetical protein